MVALPYQFVEKQLYGIGNLFELVACEEFEVYQHLVIA